MADTITRPSVPDVEGWVRAYYALPDNGVGGSLHIVLVLPAELHAAVLDVAIIPRLSGATSKVNASLKHLAVMSRTQRLKLSRRQR